MRSRVTHAFALLAAGTLMQIIAAGPAHAQEEAAAECRSRSGGHQEAESRCLSVVQAVEIAQPRLGLAFAGGNPVPGTASTLGMRLGTLPRVSVAARVTGVWTEIPDVLGNPEEELGFPVPSVDLDATVGLFSGFSPAPTVGGMGSIDLLGSVGIVPVPEGEGFADERPTSWGVGARVGILRESFVAPGISVSAMYRRMDEVVYGDTTLTDDDAYFRTDLSSWNLRAAISKRLLFLGATAGVGYDKFSSDMAAGVAIPGGLLTQPVEVRVPTVNMENDRVNAFVNLSWTLLILHVVGEAGWQSGGDVVEGARVGADFDPAEGTYFASLAIRLSI